MKAKFCGLGAKYGGPCAVCGRQTGSRPFELEQTLLWKREDGKFAVTHDLCVGAKTKHRVSGGIAFRTEPPSEIEVAP